MGKKYVIEFEDSPSFSEDGVDYFKCLQAPWWYISNNNIEKLEEYEPHIINIAAVERRSYLQGLEEAWEYAGKVQIMDADAIKEIFKTDADGEAIDGENGSVEEMIDRIKDYEAEHGKIEHSAVGYKTAFDEGAEAAWDAAWMIYAMPCDEAAKTGFDFANEWTAKEAIARVKEYRERGTFVIGDEVQSVDNSGKDILKPWVVFKISQNSLQGFDADFNTHVQDHNHVRKTGRHFNLDDINKWKSEVDEWDDI